MGMYYQGSSEIQADGLQTLYLMNPNYIGYSDTQQQQQQQQQTSMLFLNSAAASGNALSAANFPHAALQSQSQVQAQVQAQHFVGVPLPATLHDLSRQSVHDVVSASHHGLIQRLWNQNGGGGGGSGSGGGNESRPHIPSSTVVSPNSGGGGGTTTDFASQLGFQRPMVVSPTQHHQGGLSLSLSPQQQQQHQQQHQQQQQQNLNFRSLPLDHHHHHHDISTQNYQVGMISSPSPRTTNNNNNNDHIRGSGASSSSVSNGISGMILGSKYLKAAQVLLDEVVNVGKNIINGGEDGFEAEAKEKRKLNNESNIALGSDTVGGESSKNGVAELTTAQRQELQMKKAKLLSMLDEVEQRYRQYHHQMQIIVASFEQAAGIGSAKSYTQLALHTISKQFRSLKDGIAGQIKATSKGLGEEDNSGGKIEGSRLKYVDHHLRQQCALQQLGMMQPNAWRPQRGLPERAVSVLRAWLFEHFLHPYPKDSDKIMLAKQTGLTRSQVSNWFINARVRLWKPMVEEMYLEEVKNQEQNGLEGNTNKNVEANHKLEVGSKSSVPQDPTKLIRKDKQEKPRNMHDTSPTEISTSIISTSPTGTSLQAQAAGFSFIGSLNMENTAGRNAKRTRNDIVQNSPSSILSVDMETKALEITNKGLINSERQTRDDQSYSLMTDYTMGDFGRFNPEHHQLATSFHGNGVSLTLGLPPSENQHNFLSNQNIGLGSRLESHYDRMGNPQATHPNISYETIDFQSGKRFAAQLLPDFVS